MSLIDANVITDDSCKLSILPKYLGSPGRMILGESFIFDAMGSLNPKYTGGEWQFVELSNGSFYMRVRDGEPAYLTSPNGTTLLVSGDGAGVVASLFGIRRLAERTESDLVIGTHRQLEAFARQHLEWAQIQRLID